MTQPRRILVTSALVYSNGPVHLGHMLEQIQTDIWVRAMKMRGHDVIYVCADDTHGSPVMLRAEREGIPIEAMLARFYEEHTEDIAGFAIGVDKYHTTHSEETRHFTELIYTRLRDGGHTTTREVRQLYDLERGMFLPDRFVKGTCPRCASPNQNGDNCEVCGATYSPTDLIDPISVVSGTRPVERTSEHYFVKLGDFEKLLRAWVSTDRLQPEIVNKLDEWFAEQLRDWDISRDAPYFGFEIPDAPGKYFYVWFDAPIGYMGSFKALLRRDAASTSTPTGRPTRRPSSTTSSARTSRTSTACSGRRCSTAPASGCRPRCSSTAGSTSTARRCRSRAAPSSPRARSSTTSTPSTCATTTRRGSREGVADIDLSFQDYVNRVNSDLVGKIVNIASRCSGFLDRLFEGRLGAALDTPDLYARAAEQAAAIGDDFEKRAYNRAVRRITAIADEANKWIDERKPWEIARDEHAPRRAPGGPHHRHQPVPHLDGLPQAGAAAHRREGRGVSRRRAAHLGGRRRGRCSSTRSAATRHSPPASTRRRSPR